MFVWGGGGGVRACSFGKKSAFRTGRAQQRWPRPLQYMCGPDKKYPARDKKMATDLSGKRSVQVIDRHRDSNLQIEVGVFPGCAFSTTGKGAMRTVPRRLPRRRPFQRYLTCLGLRKVEHASLSHRVPSYCRVELSRGYFFPLACEN